MSFEKIKKFLLNLFSERIFYVNSYESLPQPLSKEDEEKYIAMLNEDSQEAKNALIEHNLRLVVYIARKFESTYCNLDDMISIGSIGLIKAINTYKPDKNIKLATYASKCIENEILMFIRKTGKRKLEISLDEPLNSDSEGNELVLSDLICSDDTPISHDIEKESELQMLSDALGTLNDSDRSIINMRFGMNGKKRKTQKEVADFMHISQSYISRLEKRIVFNLRKEMYKLLK